MLSLTATSRSEDGLSPIDIQIEATPRFTIRVITTILTQVLEAALLAKDTESAFLLGLAHAAMIDLMTYHGMEHSVETITTAIH